MITQEAFSQLFKTSIRDSFMRAYDFEIEEWLPFCEEKPSFQNYLDPSKLSKKELANIVLNMQALIDVLLYDLESVNNDRKNVNDSYDLLRKEKSTIESTLNNTIQHLFDNK